MASLPADIYLIENQRTNTIGTVYDYSDYRVFLKDYYESRKAKKPSFSYRYFAERAGINSAPFFKFIIEGKRNLTRATVLKTSNALKLTRAEAEYFENLVFFNQAKSLRQKNLFFDRLIQKQKRTSAGKISDTQYEYFAEWYHCIIRELVCMVDFREDYAKLGRMLAPVISARQAKNSVKLLLDLGFLEKDNGCYRQTEPVVTTGLGMVEHKIVHFQITMLRNAMEAFERFSSHERMTSATTMAISEKNFYILVEKIRNLRSELLKLACADDPADRVYELVINLFPMSNRLLP
jgi:uncharacterized protein (TIGR02147 family)